MQKIGISRGLNVFHDFHRPIVDFMGLAQKQPTSKSKGPDNMLCRESVSPVIVLAIYYRGLPPIVKRRKGKYLVSSAKFTTQVPYL